MHEWQKRVMSETTELDIRLAALEKFLQTNTFFNLDPYERERLSMQREHMKNYSHILHERMVHFKIDE